jgi:vacuolar-type H+-ATPase subunit C/Vma6
MEMSLLILLGGIILVVGIVIFPVFKYGPLAYGTARVRVKKSRLFNDDELLQLTKKPFKEILYALEEKGYPQILSLVNEDFRATTIQRVLRTTYLEELTQIVRYVPRQHEAFFKTLLMQHDLELIVALLRGAINPNATPIKEFTMAGVYITKEDLEQCDTLTFEQIRQLIRKTPFASLAELPLEDICKKEDIQTLVYDKYYSKILETSRSDRYLEQYAKLLVDIYNIRKALTFMGKEILHKGNLSSDIVNSLERSKTLVDVQRALENTAYVLSGSSVSECITQLFRHKKQFGKNLARKESISISQFLAYFIQKHTELRNIRLILKLTKVGLEPQKIAEVLL